MMVRHFLSTVFGSFLITALSHYYLYIRLVEPVVGTRNIFWISVFMGLCAYTLFGFVLLRIIPHFLRKFFEFFLFLWLGIGFIAMIFCFLTIPLEIIFKLLNINQVYIWDILVGCTGAVSIYAIYNALREPEILNVTIPVETNMPAEFENIKIAMISDVHVSGLVTRKRVERITTLVNSIDADIVCITGDLMDGTVEQLHTQMEPFKLIKAKKRVVYITGNHEFYSGPHHWKEYFKNHFGWKILSNSSQIIDFDTFQINFLGIEDKLWLKYKKIPKHEDNRLQKSVQHLEDHITTPEKPAYTILLAHQPKDWREFIKFPWINLQLSGHTHGGGQMWPLHYLVKKDQTYYSGLSKIPNTNQHIYVNQGTGFWGPPMRLGTTSEITCIQFVKPKSHFS